MKIEKIKLLPSLCNAKNILQMAPCLMTLWTESEAGNHFALEHHRGRMCFWYLTDTFYSVNDTFNS